MIVRSGRPAMVTWFEALLVGDDEEHLMAVGEAALDEVARVERLLSGHDPASETSRINREAGSRPVRVDREMFAVLASCRAWLARTGGYFDPCVRLGPDAPRFSQTIQLDEGTTTVRFLRPSTRLDFGGFGKGYALDAAARVLDEFGVRSALIHGGTSSVLARGSPVGSTAWRVGLRDPFDPAGQAEVLTLDLSDVGLSSSAAFHPGSESSDVVDPIAARPVGRQAGCSVLAPTAAEAEVLSTALLAMGKTRASEMFASGSFPGCRAAWIGRDGDRSVVEWLGEEGGWHERPSD